ncbi:MAG: hypothetical protein MUC54_05045 [Chloroflexi bacterium]|jgi:hypothetical protein|nr:hypothetical protein [Chloroflexota bacterium]
MRARLVAFGEIEVAGVRYPHDIVIEAGRVRKRRKGPSKALRAAYGHTPLTAAEDLPWGGRTLFIGTGADGALPIDPSVEDEARRRGVTIEAAPTAATCERLADLPAAEVHAVLHVTC